MRRATPALIPLALAVGLAAPPAAHAKPDHPDRVLQARVVSVDGPARLTVRAQGRTLRLRLLYVDSPDGATSAAPAECGADAATDALRSMLASRKTVSVSLPRAVGADPSHRRAVRPIRDLSGRLIADVVVLGPKRKPLGSLSARLINGDWGRPGFQARSAGTVDLRGGGNALVEAFDESRFYDWNLAGYDPAQTRQPPVGLTALCGGHVHLPGGAPVPVRAPLPWSIDDSGTLDAVGPLELQASAGKGLPMAKVLARLPGGESTLQPASCETIYPELGLALRSFDFSIFDGKDGALALADCAKQTLISVSTLGLNVPTGRGGATGDLAATITPLFPASSIGPESTDVSRPPTVFFFGPPTITDVATDSSTTPSRQVKGRLNRTKQRVMSFDAELFDFASTSN